MTDLKKMTREQLEKECEHQQQLVQSLTQVNGEQNTAILSLQLVTQRQQKELLAQQESMMAYMENAKEEVKEDVQH